MATVTLLAASNSAVTFEDVFTVSSIDPEGRKYDRVSRLHAHSHAFNMDLVLDWNCEIYPLHEGDTFSLAMAKSLQKGLYEEEGEGEGEKGKGGAGKKGVKKEKEAASWRVDGPPGLEEYFDYVCYGKVYRFDEGVNDKVTAFISYGGLLMTLSGSYRNMGSISTGNYTYLLVRRVS